jgi:hypothetical protein
MKKTVGARFNGARVYDPQQRSKNLQVTVYSRALD